MFEKILHLLFLASPLFILTTFLYPTSLPRTILLSAVTLLAVIQLFKKKSEIKLTRPDLAFGSFVFFTAISSLWSNEFVFSFFGNFERAFGALFWVQIFIIYIAIKTMGAEKRIGFLQSHTIIAGLMGAVGLFQKINPNFLETFSGERIGGTLGNAIFLAMYLTIAIFISLYHYTTEKNNFWKKTIITSIIVQVLALFLTKTDGAFLAIICSIPIGLIFTAFRKNTKATFITIIIVVTAALSSLFYIAPKLTATTIQTRLINWEMAFEGFAQKPLIGWGFNMYRSATDLNFNPKLFKFGLHETNVDKPHNQQLETLVNTGIIGFALYVIFITSFVYLLYTSEKITKQQFFILISAVITHEIQNAFAFETNASIIPLTTLLLIIQTHGKDTTLVTIKNKLAMLMILIIPTIATIFYLTSSMQTNLAVKHAKIAPINTIFTRDFYDVLTESDLEKNSEIIKTTSEKNIRTYPENAFWNLKVGNLYAKLFQTTKNIADYSSAKTLLEKAMHLSPNRPEAYLNLGQLELQMKNLSAAEFHFNQARNLNNEAAIPHWYLGIIKLDQGNIEIAYAEIMQALEAGFIIPTEEIAQTIYTKLIATGLYGEADLFLKKINQ